MKSYKYICAGCPFGCVVNRSRKTSINKHESKCIVVRKYKKYIDAVRRVPELEKEIERLKLLKGRERIVITGVDTREFVRLFAVSKKLQETWKLLFAAKKSNGVPALIVLFLSQVPRFYKISQCKQLVEVKGYFELIRTYGQIHNVTLGDLAQSLFFVFANAIDDHHAVLGYKPEQLEKFKVETYQCLPDDNKSCIAFMRNALIQEARRRSNNDPVQFHSVKIDLNSEQEYGQTEDVYV